MEKNTVKNWLMSESNKRLRAFKANPNAKTLRDLREIQSRFRVEIRIIDRKILELGGEDSDDSLF